MVGIARQRRQRQRPTHPVALARQLEHPLPVAQPRRRGVKTTLAALVVSITEPPPTARKLSAPASLARLGAARDHRRCRSPAGPSSKTPATSSPPSATPASTLSTSPVPRITCVGDDQRLAPPPSFANSNPALRSGSRPAITRVGDVELVEVLEAVNERSIRSRRGPAPRAGPCSAGRPASSAAPA